MKKLTIFLMLICINSYAGFLDPEILREAGEGAATGNIESIQQMIKNEEDAKRRLDEFYKSREQYSPQGNKKMPQLDEQEIQKQRIEAERINAEEEKKVKYEKIRAQKISKAKDLIKKMYDKEFSSF